MLRRFMLWLSALLATAGTAAAQCERMRLFASDNKPWTDYAKAVATDGVTAIVGASSENSTGAVAGATYVYDISRGVPVEIQKIIPTNVTYSAQSGRAVALDGPWLAVSNDNEWAGGVQQSGSVNLYHRPGGPGTPFVFHQKIQAAVPGFEAHFGLALSMDGDRLLVGARWDSTIGWNAGTAYVFELQGSAWTEVTKLLASDGGPGQIFGSAVAIHGDTALVGAPGAPSPGGGNNAGAAYVFERTGSGWVERQKLMISNPLPNLLAGRSVALWEDWAFMGVPSWDQPYSNSGTAFVFRRIGGIWVETQILSVQDPVPKSAIANSLAVYGSLLLAAAPGSMEYGVASGAVYLFEQSGGIWTSTMKIVPEGGGEGDAFGGAVALRDGVALIGAPNTDEACPGVVTCNSGSAMVYDLGSDSFQHSSCPSPAGPCGNHDGWGGCVSSSGFGAVLASCGSGSLGADDLSLHGRWLPAGAPVILLMGGGSGAPQPFGDGLFCIAPGAAGTNRMQLGVAGTTGHVSFGPGLHAGLSGTPFQWLQPGDERHYQVWFRDPSGPCASGHNLSNALRVRFRP